MRSIRNGEQMMIRLVMALCLCVVGVVGQRAGAQEVQAAPVTIEPEATSFGVLLPGEIVRKSFEIVNNGSEELKLVTIAPSCPCITVRTEEDTIAPGGRLAVVMDIEAGWDPHKPTRKNVSLFFDGYDIATHVTTAFAVDHGVRTDVYKIELRRGLAGRVRMKSKDGKAFSVLRVDGKKPNFPGGFDPEKQEPRTEYSVTYDFTGRGGAMPLHLTIETDHPDAQILALPIVSPEANAKRDAWQTGPIRSLRRSVVLGEVAPGTDVEFEFDIYCKAGEFSLDTTAVNHGEFWVDIVSKKVKSGSKWRVKARLSMLDGSYRGLFDETIILRAGGNLQTSFQVVGRIVDTGSGEGEQGDG